MRRRNVRLGLIVVLVLFAGVILASPYLTASNQDPLSGNRLLAKGHVTYYAFGASSSTPVTLSKSHRLMGGFDTNSSVIFYGMTSQEYRSQSPEFKSPITYYFSTGNVKSAAVNTTLYAGDYDLVFRFVNDTGRLVITFNGTGAVSTTALTITQTFALTPAS